MTQEPIELKPEDIIRRPPNVEVGSKVLAPAKEKGPLEEFRGLIKDVREFRDLLDEMGVKIPGMPDKEESAKEEPAPTAAQAAKAAKEAASSPPRPSEAQQLQVLLTMLQVKYGDITINQLIANLIEEYGKRKLSSIKVIK